MHGLGIYTNGPIIKNMVPKVSHFNQKNKFSHQVPLTHEDGHLPIQVRGTSFTEYHL